MPQLVEQFASKASLKQRRGRAGRVRNGTSYKLISRDTYDALRDHSEPEIRRVALDQTLLQLIFLGVERGTGTFTSTLLDPPSKESMEAATFSLQKLGAVESDGDEGGLMLTPLGEHLAAIPAPPTVGKRKSVASSILLCLLLPCIQHLCLSSSLYQIVLVMGSILGCRETALAMAAGISLGRSPFLRVDAPREKKHSSKDKSAESPDETKQRRILEQRAELEKEAGNSDHALLAAVFLKWRATENGKQHSFCDSLGLSHNVLRDIAQLFQQLDSSLVAAGFSETNTSNVHQSSLRIIHTCAVAAMAPSQLARVRRPATKYQETAEGAKEKEGEARELSFFVRTDNGEGQKEERVFIHPASINFHTGNYSCPFLVYHSMVRTSKPFLRDVTECSAYALLLFGGDIEIKASKGIVSIDGWAELAANGRIGSLMGGLRRRMDVLLTDKIKSPSLDISSSDVMKLIVKLITSDGLAA
jgi:ATP-dependent RNA helicase DHX57